LDFVSAGAFVTMKRRRGEKINKKGVRGGKSVTVSGSILQLSDDDSTSSSRMEREEEKE
jgi:hypothetical protein